MKRIYRAAKKRKFLIALILAAVAAGIVFLVGPHGSSNAAVEYLTAPVTRGDLTQTVSGTGQVEATQQLIVKSKGSGAVLAVNVKQGEKVKQGDLLAQVDPTAAGKQVRDAEANLESALISLKKLQQPASATALLQAEDALATAKQQLTDLQAPADSTKLLAAQNAVSAAEDNSVKAASGLATARNDGFAAVADAQLDLLNTTKSLDSIINGHDLDASQSNGVYLENSFFGVARDQLMVLVQAANVNYTAAKTAYDVSFATYAAADSNADPAVIDNLINQTTDTARAVTNAVKSENTLVNFVDSELTAEHRAVPAAIKTFENTLSDLTSTMNGRVGTLLARQTALKNAVTGIPEAERSLASAQASLTDLNAGAKAADLAAARRTVAEKQAALDALNAGPNDLDLESARLSLRMRQNSLSDVRETLADYSVRAPFDGVVAEVAVHENDNLSSGGDVATLITEQSLARIAFNETDIAKIKEGARATLTFDAVPGLEVEGQVAAVDIIGTVSQGVVSYGVEIAFNAGDPRVRPGMTVTGAITVSTSVNVLMAPNAAVKAAPRTATVGGGADAAGRSATVQVLDTNGAVQSVLVTVGSSSDAYTEIISGLAEGDKVVIGTKTAVVNRAASGTAGAAGNRSAAGFGGGAALRIPGLTGGAGR